MATKLAKLETRISAQILQTIFGVSEEIPAIFGAVVFLAAGTAGPNTFSQMYAATRSLTSGAADVMDLTNASLLQPNGSTFVAADVVVWGIKAADGNTSDIVVGGGTGAMSSILGATSVFTLPPGASAIFTNPLPATAWSVSNHKIQVTTVGSAAYDIIILSH